MKKIYSIVLMAAALLVGTNVWADDFSVVNHTKGTNLSTSDLQAAIDFAAPGDSITITLLSKEHELTAPVVIPNPSNLSETNTLKEKSGQKITLDLNGNTIKGAATLGVIQIFKGSLNIIGNGEIVRGSGAGSKNYDKSAITVYGAPWDKKDKVWTELTIGENVLVTTAAAEQVYGVCIQNSSALPSGVTTAKLGYDTYYAKGKKETVDAFKARMNELGIYSYSETGTAGCAYGVKVLVKGKIYGHHRGINILGTLNGNPQQDITPAPDGRQYAAYPYYDYKYPYVKLYPTAHVWCFNEDLASGNGGIYAAGYAILDISGTVQGQTGILVKAGDIKLTDAVVESTSDKGSNNGNYKGDVAGSGIFITTDKSYAGSTAVVLEGDTKVKGGGSAAITDVLATNSTETAVSHLDINGGTIEPGAGGAINMTAGTAVNTTVSGGNITGTVTKTDPDTGAEVIEVVSLIPQDGNHHVTEVVVDGKTTIVVSEGAQPEGSANVAGHAATDAVKWTGAAETLSADVTLAELEINQTTAQVLTVAEGKTLTVGRVVLGEKAQIIVEAGAKFVVTGTQGIVAPVKSNIILKIENGKQAFFLFNPAVTSNRNPSATVALETKSFWNGSDYAYERMGMPSVDGMTLNDIVKVAGAADVNALYWDVTIQDWKAAAKTQVMDPFAGLALLSMATTPGSKYNFPCRLLGNSDVNLTVQGEWTYFANSYLALLDMKEMALGIEASGETVAAAFYIDKNGTEDWVPYSLDDLLEGIKVKELNPMQGFILRNNGATPTSAKVAIDYEDMVWDPVYDPTHVKKAAYKPASDLSRVVITITNNNGKSDEVTLRQSEKYSAEYDNGSDFEKYMGLNAIDFYATTELGEMAQVAMDNIEGVQLSIAAQEAASYKMTFTNVTGEQLAIRDNMTGSVITMTEDAEYIFSVAEGTNANRFEIVSIKNAATDVETVVEATGAKAVYTILGQYMGTTENWNTLPAGIYVVDGVKMVK